MPLERETDLPKGFLVTSTRSRNINIPRTELTERGILNSVFRRGRSNRGGWLDATLDQLRPFGPVEVISASENGKFLDDVDKLLKSGMIKEEANPRAFELLCASVNSAIYNYNRRHELIQNGDEDNKARLTRDESSLRLILYKGRENNRRT
jgi:hypothetical protein